MAALNTFVANYIPLSLRHTRDFTGDRGWVHIGNQVLKRLEAEGLLPQDRVMEVPVFIENDYYPNEIFLPTDFKRALDVYEYDDTDRHYEWEMVNGRLRLEEDYEDNALVDTTSRQTNGGEATTSTTITTYGSADDEWLWNGVWFQSTNYNSTFPERFDGRDCRLVWRSAESTDTIYFRPALPAAPANGDYVYFFENFLMLRYEAVYALLSAESSEIPLAADLETVMASGMIALASVPGSKERRQAEKDFEQDISNAGKAHFTPSVEQARPKGRDWPDFDTDTKNTHTWSGS